MVSNGATPLDTNVYVYVYIHEGQMMMAFGGCHDESASGVDGSYNRDTFFLDHTEANLQ